MSCGTEDSTKEFCGAGLFHMLVGVQNKMYRSCWPTHNETLSKEPTHYFNTNTPNTFNNCLAIIFLIKIYIYF